jgi:hypothetical protein
MRDSQEMQKLEAEITHDERKYSEIEGLEAGLMKDNAPRGFSEFSRELAYRDEKEALADSIRKRKEMLAGLRNHPDWPHNEQIFGPETNLKHSNIAVAAYYIWLGRKDKIDDFSRSQTAESDWAEAVRNLLVRV